jgi:acetyl esterase/lipase
MRRRRFARAALALALLSAIPPIRVLVQIPSTIRAFDATLSGALGPDSLERVPDDVRAAWRPSPVSARQLLFGLDAPPTRSTAGIEFAAPHGERLRLNIYRPAHDRPSPVVVQIYGGAWRSGGPGDDAALARALAGAGYVVVAIDYRHAPAHQWPAQIDDVRLGIRWVRDHAAEYGGDPSRLAIIGRSAGSQLAMIAPNDPTMPSITAVVGYYGPVDLAEGYRHPPVPDPLGVRAIDEAFLGGSPDDRPAAYAEASPITFAGRPHPPTLIIAAGRDHIVQPHFSRRLHESLGRSGTSVLLVIPWADHAFDAVPFGPSSQIAIYYTQRFLAWAFSRAASVRS